MTNLFDIDTFVQKLRFHICRSCGCPYFGTPTAAMYSTCSITFTSILSPPTPCSLPSNTALMFPCSPYSTKAASMKQPMPLHPTPRPSLNQASSLKLIRKCSLYDVRDVTHHTRMDVCIAVAHRVICTQSTTKRNWSCESQSQKPVRSDRLSARTILCHNA